MSEFADFREWDEHNLRVREGYLAAFEKLPPAELPRTGAPPTRRCSRSRVASWGPSGGGSRWPLPLGPADASDPPTLEEVRRLERETDAAVREHFRGPTEKELDRRYPIPKSAGCSQKISVTLRDTLRHRLEEEIQERGERNPLLGQMEVEPPVLD
jgi:hypothetical protein